MLKHTAQKGQYTLTTTLDDLARACHLRTDDVQLTLTELGFLSTRRRLPPKPKPRRHDDGTHHGTHHGNHTHHEEADDMVDGDELGEWDHIEVVITRDAVEEAWARWRVRERGVLDEKYCLV